MVWRSWIRSWRRFELIYTSSQRTMGSEGKDSSPSQLVVIIAPIGFLNRTIGVTGWGLSSLQQAGLSDNIHCHVNENRVSLDAICAIWRLNSLRSQYGIIMANRFWLWANVPNWERLEVLYHRFVTKYFSDSPLLSEKTLHEYSQHSGFWNMKERRPTP